MKFSGALSDIEFYSDKNDPTVTYAEVIVPAIGASLSPHKIFVEIDDDKLKSYIRQFVLPNLKGNTTVGALLQDVKDCLALGRNPDTIAPRVRTAGKLSKGLIEYDLNTYSHDYVKVTPTGWKICQNARYKFLKRNTLGMQVHPQETDKNLLTLLRPYVNTDRAGLILFATWIVQAFCMGNHSAMLVMASAGSGKTMLTKMARRILDPSKLDTNVMSEKKDDLFSILSNSYFVAFDNCEELSKETSNVLCSAVTGATMAKRKLYTTNELGVFELHNAVLMNGIDILPAYSDLASRCLLLKLKEIDEKDRKTDAEIMEAFERDLPEILGAIFNALTKAMTTIKMLRPKRLPRMAAPYLEMLAIAVAMGISETTFEKLYFENLSKIDKERTNIAVVEAIEEFMISNSAHGRRIEGTVTALYKKIVANYSGSARDLPKSASHFSRKLKQEQKAIEAAGYTINLDDTFADGTHMTIIRNK